MISFKKRLIYAVSCVSFVVTLIGINIQPLITWAVSGPTITGGSAVSGKIGTNIPIGSVQISAIGNPNIPVHLFVKHGNLQMGVTTGLTFTGSSTGASIYFNGNKDDVNVALASLGYTRTDGLGDDALEVSLAGAGETYYPANGHIYEYVSANVDWNTANSLANASVKYGLTGYLATMTSAGENDYISARLPDAGWMGASDSTNEGDWKWVGGPENGTSFYSGLGYSGGHAVNGAYSNWNSGEPNDSGNNEDCGQFLSGSSGQWNDLPCTGFNLSGYVIEYGDSTVTPDIQFKSVPITVSADTVHVSNCAELMAVDDAQYSNFNNIILNNNIDCTAQSVTSLFSSDNYGGVFDGHGYTISNVTINQPNDCNVGLFARVFGGVVKNLVLHIGSVSGECYVGSVVGYVYNASVQNVTSDFAIHGTNGSEVVGGLIGYIDSEENGSVTVSDSSFNGTINGGWDNGGLIGQAYAYNGTINILNSFSTGSITADYSENGGLVGYLGIDQNSTVNLQKCYATGEVSGTYNNGGLVGYVYVYSYATPSNINIQDCYAQGNITSTIDDAGGLIGYLYSYSDEVGITAAINISRTYASGNVAANGSNAGGLIGYSSSLPNPDSHIVVNKSFAVGQVSSGNIINAGGLIGDQELGDHLIESTNNYFDQTNSGQNACAGINELLNCTGINTSSSPDYFKNNHSNAPLNSWNFNSIWVSHISAYPTFSSDIDSDGASASVENAAPNSGDANNDGILDSLQGNVTSFPDSINNNYITVEVSSGCATTTVSAASEASKAVIDSGYDYPAGLVNFSTDCGSNGFTATIALYFYEVKGSNLVARKFNPNTNAYYTIPGAVISDVTIGGKAAKKVVYQITDGSIYDQDGSANGIIVDPAGIALSAVKAPNTGLGGFANW